MPDRSRLIAVFDGAVGDPAAQGWKPSRTGDPEVVTTEFKADTWWITDNSNGPDGLTYSLDLTAQNQADLKQGWVLEIEVDLQKSDTPEDRKNQTPSTCDVKILHENGVLHHLDFALAPGGDHGKRAYSWSICGIEHPHQKGDRVQLEMKPDLTAAAHRLTMRIAGIARSFIKPGDESPSVPTRIEWGSPSSDGTSRAAWKKITLHQADWSELNRQNQTAQDAISPEQLSFETGWDFSLPFPKDRLENDLLGTPPMAMVGKNLVVCAPVYVPGDEDNLLLFVMSPKAEPMTTGLCWHLRYLSGTSQLSQILVTDESQDDWLQKGNLKRDGRAKPGESSSDLIERYRAAMIRLIESDPKLFGKKECAEASADYAKTIHKLWAQHQKLSGKNPPGN